MHSPGSWVKKGDLGGSLWVQLVQSAPCFASILCTDETQCKKLGKRDGQNWGQTGAPTRVVSAIQSLARQAYSGGVQ